MEMLQLEAEKFSYHYQDPLCITKIEQAVRTMLHSFQLDESMSLVYLCIGTDRATGDCLGPLVGTRLKLLLPSAHVLGTLDEPAHAANLEEVLHSLTITYSNPFVVAIDASLGNADRIGFINVNKGCLKPGTALKKVLPEVGQFHISGVVNVGGYLEYMVLQNTRLGTVYRMADIISRSLFLAHLRYTEKQGVLAR
ncbi:MAG TPA: spore protease YyaC [Syntrophomonas sp.]|jgi:putative sporulation protein YyaC|nr:spore protease YyaC [Syntrophomonas sp.]